MRHDAICNSNQATGGGRTGVYVGCMYHEWLDVMVAAGMALAPRSFVGNGAAYMVGRLSYTFGLTGPCVSTDTACSSSLIAAHLAHKGAVCSFCFSTALESDATCMDRST